MILLAWLVTAAAYAKPIKTIEVSSPPVALDKTYHDMQGISRLEPVNFLKHEPPKTRLWLNRFAIEVKDERTGKAVPEALCHSSYRLSGPKYVPQHNWDRFQGKTHQINFFAGMFQGILDLKLPDGFAVPVFSDEEIHLDWMLINPTGALTGKTVRAAGKIAYFDDAAAKAQNIKPVFRRLLSLKVPHAEAAGGHGHHGHSGAHKPVPYDAAKWTNEAGDAMAHHWLVPPGRHLYRYELPRGLQLPFDTKIHHASIHMHPHGKVLVLRDLTLNKVVWRAEAENAKTGRVLERSTVYSSGEGLPVFQNHRYELEAVYDNPTKETIDAMAVLSLYMAEKAPL